MMMRTLTLRITEPVEITLPHDGSQNIEVAPASAAYLEMASHPAYRSSSIVQHAAAASRLIVTTSSYVSKSLQNGADSFTQNTKPSTKPMTFSPVTHARMRKLNSFSASAAGISAKTVGSVGKYAQNIGAGLGQRNAKSGTRGINPDGSPDTSYKPGLLNKSMIAFSTVADGIEQAGKTLLSSSSSAASTVVAHRFGSEAGELSRHVGGGVRNVGLVYIDAAGVSRRAVLKSVAKGMVVGRVRGTGDLVVGGDAKAETDADADASIYTLDSSTGRGSKDREPTSSTMSRTPRVYDPSMSMSGGRSEGNLSGGGGSGTRTLPPLPARPENK